MVAPGDVLLDKYRVERELGRGGMGLVFAARHVMLDELVAIKMVLPDHAQSDEVVRRFMREARAAAKIASEHVVRVSDVGRLPTGEPYMVMEMLHGEDLDSLLRSRGPLPLADAVDYVMQALEAVAEAHAAGIVHRDLKPANLFVTERRNGTPCVKVLDFGISKLASTDLTAGAVAMTRTQGLLGSPLYMSPEQLESARDVDHRADLWSFGVILHQLLSAQLPFMAETLPQLITKVLSKPPAPLHEVRADLPEGIQQVVLRCLERDRNLRPQSAAELAAMLVPFGSASSQSSFVAIENVGRARGAPIVRSLPPPPNAPLTDVAIAPTVNAPTGSQSTLAPLGGTQGGPAAVPSNRGRTILVAGLAALLTAGIAFAAVSAAHRTDASSAGSPAATPPVRTAQSSVAAAAPSPAAITIPMPSTSTSAPDEVAAAKVAPPQASTIAKPVTSTSKPRVPASVSAATVAAPAPKSNCDPPYTFDAKGNKKFKAECL